MSYVLNNQKPYFLHGKVIRSRLTSWNPAESRSTSWHFGYESGFIPEPFQMADVLILVKGGKGTRLAAHWARLAKRPILPVTYFGGAASEIYDQEYNSFDEKYSGFVERIDYETLNEIGEDWDAKAKKVVDLAKNIATSKLVFVSMPYPSEGMMACQLNNFLASIEIVCRDFSYKCEKVAEKNVQERILPTILRRIEQSGFLIVDLTELRPNVFYELGYANGLGKSFIVTAREETELPFNVRDMPVLFWTPEDQVRLRNDLTQRVRIIAESQGIRTQGS